MPELFRRTIKIGGLTGFSGQHEIDAQNMPFALQRQFWQLESRSLE
jgi:hypothetical protein